MPYLCGFRGRALFLDADMVVTGDIAELFEKLPYDADVAVMQDQARFEWASMMFFNCDRCQILTPEYVENTENNPLMLNWARKIGTLPKEWNFCVGYRADNDPAKLYHFTTGIPCWPETQGKAQDKIWFEAFEAALATCSYAELMGASIHAEKKNA